MKNKMKKLVLVALTLVGLGVQIGCKVPCNGDICQGATDCSYNEITFENLTTVEENVSENVTISLSEDTLFSADQYEDTVFISIGDPIDNVFQVGYLDMDVDEMDTILVENKTMNLTGIPEVWNGFIRVRFLESEGNIFYSAHQVQRKYEFFVELTSTTSSSLIYQGEVSLIQTANCVIHSD